MDYAQDLPAVEAVYHQVCNVNFRTGKQIPLQLQEPSPKTPKISKGRPENTTQSDAFMKAIEYLEKNDDEQITISDLVNKMGEFCVDEPYSSRYMKKKYNNTSDHPLSSLK